MKRSQEKTLTSRRLALPGLLLLAALPLTAIAQPPYGRDRDDRARHPRYLHALADLRTARWLISHRADTRAEARDEEMAVFEIDQAYREITAAAINDGKDINRAVGVDVPQERGGRLRQALELLRQIRADVDREEDDPYTRGLRDRASLHIDNAIRATVRALEDKRFDDRDRWRDRDHDR
jgi:hypothetical protein